MSDVLIVCPEGVYGNTRQVAEVMSDVLGADLKKPSEAGDDLSGFSLVGFGSGIYGGKHADSLFELIESVKLPERVFIFSTSGFPGLSFLWHLFLRRELRWKDCEVVKEFSCPGFEDIGFFKWFGGVNKGRPGEEDLERARDFAKGLMA